MSLDGSGSLAASIHALLDTEDRVMDEQTLPWVKAHFEHVPMIKSVESLLHLKSDIRFLEGEMMWLLAASS
ncbi:MAG: hypothetical protein R2751_16315 [Bacteroidales bacterium]